MRVLPGERPVSSSRWQDMVAGAGRAGGAGGSSAASVFIRPSLPHLCNFQRRRLQRGSVLLPLPGLPALRLQPLRARGAPPLEPAQMQVCAVLHLAISITSCGNLAYLHTVFFWRGGGYDATARRVGWGGGQVCSDCKEVRGRCGQATPHTGAWEQQANARRGGAGQGRAGGVPGGGGARGRAALQTELAHSAPWMPKD